MCIDLGDLNVGHCYYCFVDELKSRSRPSEVFLGKGVRKYAANLQENTPCQSAIPIKLLSNFILKSLFGTVVLL